MSIDGLFMFLFFFAFAIFVINIVATIHEQFFLESDETRGKFRRVWAALALHVRALFWSLRHPRIHRQYRSIGIPTIVNALLVSRIMTPDQARRLGWDGAQIVRMVRGNVGKVPDPPLCDVEQLIRWAHARPDDDGNWLADLPPDLLARLTEPEMTERGLAYLTADVPHFGGPSAAFFAENAVPYSTFLVLTAEFQVLSADWDPAELTPEPWVENGMIWVIHSGVLSHIETWEVAGWLSYDSATTQDMFRKSFHPSALPFPFTNAKADWLNWHPVNEAVGTAGPHAVYWLAAGYSVHEALALLATADPPSLETLATMAALRGSA